jgi:hypothetical protein
LVDQRPVTRLSQLVKTHRALAGVNGGFWTDERRPLDWTIVAGAEHAPLTNRTRPCLVIEPRMVSIRMPEELDPAQPPADVLQAGPLLLRRGVPQFAYDDYQARAAEFDSDITADRHPRTVVGTTPGALEILVVNGRSRHSAGLYLEECARLVQTLGWDDAMNLDGGASSTLVVGSQRLNEPRFSFIRGARILSARLPGGERPIPTALLFFPGRD